jgi:chromosome segregation ATPase
MVGRGVFLLAPARWIGAAATGSYRARRRPGEDLTEAKATQQKLATAQSALSATTRLRDEAAQTLQEVGDSSAAVKKDLAAARDQLDDVQQKITARNAELTTISRRLDTQRECEKLRRSGR